MEIPEKYKKILWVLVLAFLVIISVYFVVKIFSGFENGKGDKTVNTISLSGHGEVQAAPDIANIDFTIQKDAATVKDAQASVAQIEKKALDLLKADGVADKDVQTANASFSPKYDYQQAICPPVPMVSGTAGVTVSPASPYYCPPSKQVIVGYTESEDITVKIRNVDAVGKITQGLGTLGVSNLNGPNFTIDNQDSLKAQARKLAIDDAKTKAQALAKDLGIRLGKITSFEESGNYPVPMYAKTMSVGAVSAPSAPAVIPAGENTISSDVTITYEIK